MRWRFGSRDPRAAGAVVVHRFSCPSPNDITCFSGVTYSSLRHACSQLHSEADLPENHGCPNLFLTRHWSRHVKSALLHVISVARLACVHTWAWAAGSLDPRIGQGRDKGQASTLSSPRCDWPSRQNPSAGYRRSQAPTPFTRPAGPRRSFWDAHRAEWAGFDAFCRSEFQLDAETLLKGFDVLPPELTAWVQGVLSEPPPERQPEGRDKETAGLVAEIEAAWRTAFLARHGKSGAASIT
jgi:hypothetical protein